MNRGRALRQFSVEQSLIGDTVGADGAASLLHHGTGSAGRRMLTEPAD
ncbi:hypothetical protein ACWCXX_32115 [Streptomyces sp. NPDC001732]